MLEQFKANKLVNDLLGQGASGAGLLHANPGHCRNGALKKVFGQLVSLG
jgi:hypothetical protein